MSISSTIDPAPWLRKMREENPVHFDPDMVFYFGKKGAWQVFRYEDIKDILSNHKVFSNEFIPKQKVGLGDSIAMSDPPRHKQLRALVAKAFSPALLEKLEAWLRSKCEALLAPWLSSGKMDFIKEFADLVPTSVTAQLFGIEEHYHRVITQWTRILIGDPNIIGIAAYQQVQQEMVDFLMQLMRDRQRLPREDFMTYLLHAEIDGERLSEDELISNSLAVMTAGSEAPAGLLGNAMLTFTERPALQQHLAQHTADIPKAINEVLRFRCPVLSIPRLAKEDLLLGGQQVRKGELVNCWLASANLDPAVFQAPDHFDMYRNNSRLLSFGHGIHGCIGSYMTRMEAKVAFETAFKHMRNISIAPENVLSRISNVSTFKFDSLLIRFEHIG